jgi:hypothetical protein
VTKKNFAVQSLISCIVNTELVELIEEKFPFDALQVSQRARGQPTLIPKLNGSFGWFGRCLPTIGIYLFRSWIIDKLRRVHNAMIASE